MTIRASIFGSEEIPSEAMHIVSSIGDRLVPIAIQAVADGVDPDTRWLFVTEGESGIAHVQVGRMEELDNPGFDDDTGNAIRVLARKPRTPGFIRVVFMLRAALFGGENRPPTDEHVGARAGMIVQP